MYIYVLEVTKNKMGGFRYEGVLLCIILLNIIELFFISILEHRLQSFRGAHFGEYTAKIALVIDGCVVNNTVTLNQFWEMIKCLYYKQLCSSVIRVYKAEHVRGPAKFSNFPFLCPCHS